MPPARSALRRRCPLLIFATPTDEVPGSNVGRYQMTDQTADTQNATLAALQALLAQQQPGGGFAMQPQQPALPITGISVPVKIDTPIGSVRVDIHLPAECGQSGQALQQAVQMLANAGLPVDAWQPRNDGGGYGNGGGYNRGGYGGGGGYNRGGGFGGRGGRY